MQFPGTGGNGRPGNSLDSIPLEVIRSKSPPGEKPFPDAGCSIFIFA